MTGFEVVSRRLPDAIAVAFATLHAHNEQLWQLEDRVRDTARATMIVQLKRSIDETNLARHAAIAAIDTLVVSGYRGAPAERRGAVLDSSSVGQLLDRLSILALKRDRIDDPERRHLVDATWDHMLRCLDRALLALATGRWVHHPVGEAKQYGKRVAPRRRTRAGRA